MAKWSTSALTVKKLRCINYSIEIKFEEYPHRKIKRTLPYGSVLVFYYKNILLCLMPKYAVSIPATSITAASIFMVVNKPLANSKEKL